MYVFNATLLMIGLEIAVEIRGMAVVLDVTYKLQLVIFVFSYLLKKKKNPHCN